MVGPASRRSANDPKPPTVGLASYWPRTDETPVPPSDDRLRQNPVTRSEPHVPGEKLIFFSPPRKFPPPGASEGRTE
jgi:hypothetical protein